MVVLSFKLAQNLISPIDFFSLYISDNSGKVSKTSNDFCKRKKSESSFCLVLCGSAFYFLVLPLDVNLFF